MMALQKLVADESQVFDVEKSGDNDSPNVCLGRAKRNDVDYYVTLGWKF